MTMIEQLRLQRAFDEQIAKGKSPAPSITPNSDEPAKPARKPKAK